jgi:branched-chain amino acid transport system substrate-binding protein
MSEIGGEPVDVIQLDDGSDPSAATRDARKLIEEDKVDVLIGTSTAASSNAIAAVADELKVPYLAISPISPPVADDGLRWVLCVTQPPPLMIKTVTDRIKQDGVKTLGYIGYSDAWGDFVYKGAKTAETEGALTIVANERYARTDTSVVGQVLKVVASHPEGVLDGGSGTQGALPLLGLADRGYKGKLYGTPAMVNADFIRISGKAAEGMEISAGPASVADQLPDDHYAKKPALAFRTAFQKVYGALPTDGFSAYSFDAWLIFEDAAKKALATTPPGTPAFQKALDDAIFSIKDLAGTEGLYTFTPASSYGVDERSLIVAKLENGKWVYSP